jgi:hypothetical protein
MSPAFFLLALAARVLDENASEFPGHQGEVSIAVDANAPGRLLAASMDIEDGRLLVMASSDSGDSWRRTQIPVSAGAAFHADPMVDFDSQGRAFIAHIPVAAGNHPVGIEVTHTDDLGLTFSPPVRLSWNYDRDDKVALEVDDHQESPHRDSVYVAWKWPSGNVFFSRSIDRGLTFEAPRAIDTARVTGLDMATDREGRVYLALYDRGLTSIRVYTSWDGGARFLPSVRVAPVRAGWYSLQPSHCARQSVTHASIAAGPSGVPGSADLVYVTWTDYASGRSPSDCPDLCAAESRCRTEVFFSLSRDQGATWSESLPLGLDDTGFSDRFFPWISVDRSAGAVHASFKDTRAAPSRLGTDIFARRSPDCGLSFEPAVRLSSASSFATSATFQYGDYQGLDAASGKSHAAWTDYRTSGTSEIYVGGLSDPKDARSMGWSVRREEARVTLSYRGRISAETLADVYVSSTRLPDGVRRFWTPSGFTDEESPFETRRLAPDFEVTVEMRESDLSSDLLLEAVVVPFDDTPSSSGPMSSFLAVWAADLLAGRSVGCQAN